jgi:hypothetical protein
MLNRKPKPTITVSCNKTGGIYFIPTIYGWKNIWVNLLNWNNSWGLAICIFKYQIGFSFNTFKKESENGK